MDAAMLDPDLAVRPVVRGLDSPTSMAFLGRNDFFVLEKNTGQVERVQVRASGVQQTTVLDLDVNFASERGLLGIALHPNFARNHYVYLFWTESNTGQDTDALAAVDLLANRVDRFVWNGSALTFDRNIIEIRAFQDDGAPLPGGQVQGDEGQAMAGNHDGGVITFGPDGKLYVLVGDVGRRGWLQNLTDGPTGPGVPDDQFGGPQPDDAHLTGVILRLNADGSTPRDNPLFRAGARLGGEAGENLQKVFAFGIRNSFGMAFDPRSGALWMSENADDSFDEINRVDPGFNSGWAQFMGPIRRIDQFKAIETSPEFFGLQQQRWSPENIADSPREALDRLFMPRGAHYSDPEFSWKFAVPPTALAFVPGRRLGSEFRGDLFVGNGAGQLLDFNLAGNRRSFDLGRGVLRDRVDDNTAKFQVAESARLVIGEGFGIITDVEAGPNGNLFVVSHTDGVIYEVFRRPRGGVFVTHLSGAREVPARETPARGLANFRLSRDGEELHFMVAVARIENVVAAHLHLGAVGENGPVVVSLFGPAPADGGAFRGVLARGTITTEDLTGPLAGRTMAELAKAMAEGDVYVNVHTDDGVGEANTGPGDFAAGEIRGQIFRVF
jgi:glucose/arabinose dehydrogenase